MCWNGENLKRDGVLYAAGADQWVFDQAFLWGCACESVGEGV